MANSATAVDGTVPVPQVWTNYSSVGGSISVYDSFNVSSYTYKGVNGYWLISFVNPFQDTGFATLANCGPGNAGSDGTNCTSPAQDSGSITTSSVEASTGRSNFTAGTSAYISIMCVGNKDL